MNRGGCTLRAGESSMAHKCTRKCNSYRDSGTHWKPVSSVDSESPFFGLDFALLLAFPWTDPQPLSGNFASSSSLLIPLSLCSTDANLVIALSLSYQNRFPGSVTEGNRLLPCLQLIPLESALFALRTIFLQSWPCLFPLFRFPGVQPLEAPVSSDLFGALSNHPLLSSFHKLAWGASSSQQLFRLLPLHLDVPVHLFAFSFGRCRCHLLQEGFLVLLPSFLLLQFLYYGIYCTLLDLFTCLQMVEGRSCLQGPRYMLNEWI